MNPDWQKIIKHPDRRDPPAVITAEIWKKLGERK